jgi:peroxiredoxin
MLTTLLAATLGATLSVQVGDAAPPISAGGWLNATDPQLPGKPMLVEFWGTWCGPCVAAMPHVQDLWTRYRDQGLAMAAISYEEPAVMTPFLEQHGYTMPVGSDPTRACIDAFGIESWPTTFVIDRAGKVIYRGFPSGAEPFVQQALGLETSASVLLTRCLDGGDDVQTSLEQLVLNASHAFDLANWARGQGGQPEPTGKGGPKDAAAALSKLAADWDTPRRGPALDELALAAGPFDLKSWVSDELGRRFPIGDDDFLKLIEDGLHADALEAVVTRHPSKKALAQAKSDDGLRDYCNERAAKYRENGAFLVLMGYYSFGPYEGPEEIVFPPGTGAMTEKGGKGMIGVALNTGEMLTQDAFPACIEPYLRKVLAAEALSKRKLPDDLDKAAAKLHAELLADLKKQYGSKKRKDA